MAIQPGDRIPDATLKVADENGIRDVSTQDLLGRGRVVLFSVPGAFTPTCSAKHLPGFVQHAAAIRGKGVDRIVCLAVNDAFVMQAWGRDQQVGDRVVMAADGNADFARALGLDLDAKAWGMGTRSQRFALVARDGVVEHVAVEKPGKFEVSSAEAVLAAL